MCSFLHLSETITVADNKVVVTFQDDPTDILDTEHFCFRLCQTLPTGASSLQVFLVVNGSNVPLWNRYGDIVTLGTLKTRCTYKGYYGTQQTKHVIAINTPAECACGKMCY